jgi:serpin B
MINYAATAGGDADGLQLAEFDCAPGLSMIVLLPKDEPEEMERLEQSLTAEKLRDWLARMKPPIGPQSAWRVEIPELRLKQRLALGSHLRDMGMPSAFDAATADFRGITEKQGFCIKEVLADASLTIADAWRGSPVHGSIVPVVGKDGTVPIKDVLAQFTPAVTGAMVPSLFGGGVATLDPTPGFRLDRPFVFLIRDKRSGAIVFMGRVAEPLSVAAPPDRPAAAKHRAAQNVGRAARGPRSARPGGMGGVAPSHSGSGMGMM